MATGGQTTNEAKYENQRLVSRQIGWELDDLCSRYEKLDSSRSAPSANHRAIKLHRQNAANIEKDLVQAERDAKQIVEQLTTLETELHGHKETLDTVQQNRTNRHFVERLGRRKRDALSLVKSIWPEEFVQQAIVVPTSLFTPKTEETRVRLRSMVKRSLPHRDENDSYTAFEVYSILWPHILDNGEEIEELNRENARLRTERDNLRESQASAREAEIASENAQSAKYNALLTENGANKAEVVRLRGELDSMRKATKDALFEAGGRVGDNRIGQGNDSESQGESTTGNPVETVKNLLEQIKELRADIQKTRRTAIRKTKGAACNLIYCLLRQIVYPLEQTKEWNVGKVGLLQDFIPVETFLLCPDRPDFFDWTDRRKQASFAIHMFGLGIDLPREKYDDDFAMLLLLSFGHLANHRLARRGIQNLRREVQRVEENILTPLLKKSQGEGGGRGDSTLTDLDHIKLSCLRVLLLQQLQDIKADGINYARVAAMIVQLFFTFRISIASLEWLILRLDPTEMPLLMASGLLRLRMMVRHFILRRPWDQDAVIDLTGLTAEDDNAANGAEDLDEPPINNSLAVKQEGVTSDLRPIYDTASLPVNKEVMERRLHDCSFIDPRFVENIVEQTHLCTLSQPEFISKVCTDKSGLAIDTDLVVAYEVPTSYSWLRVNEDWILTAEVPKIDSWDSESNTGQATWTFGSLGYSRRFAKDSGLYLIFSECPDSGLEAMMYADYNDNWVDPTVTQYEGLRDRL